MTLKTTLAVLALTLAPVLAPGLAFARCGGDMVKGETASSCVPGAVWDESKGACVLTPSS